MCQEVCCLRRLADPASLTDWRCCCLCSELIPSVTEKLVIFVKELSFPQTAPTDDAFFQPDWAGACWGRWAGSGLLLGWSAGCVCGSSLHKRTRKKKGQQGVCPWPLRCLSQFLSERKDRLLRGRMCCVCLRTFHRWGGLVFIVDVLPVRW